MSKYIGTPVVSLSTDTVDVTGDITTTDATPEVIIVNDTHEDTDGGREGKVTFKGQQSGGEETTLAQIQASHDGTSDDEKGDLIFKTNDGSDGASPTERLRIDSEGKTTLTTTSAGASTNPLVLHNASSNANTDVRMLLAPCTTAADRPVILAATNNGSNVCDFTVSTPNGGTPVERFKINGTGDVMIASGTDDAGYGPLQIGSTSSSSTIIQMLSTTGGANTIHFGDAASGADRYRGYIQYNHANDSLNIGQNGGDRLVIASDGQASFTGAKVSYFLWSVTNSASGNCGTYRSKTSSNADNTSSYHFVATSSSDRLFIYGNGNVVNTNNSYGAMSDEKLKENIIDSGSQWEDIKAVKVRKFSMKEDELDAPNKIGVIAQELEASDMGGLVFESPDRDEDGNVLETSTKQVHYSVLYMKAIKALQEAITKIETLETKVAALEGE